MSTHGRRQAPHEKTRGGAGIMALAAVVALGALTACGSSAGTSGSASGSASGGDQATTVSIDLTPQGCVPRPAKISAGQVRFNITNKNADAVSEAELRTSDLAKILGEQENLTPGLSGGFALTIQHWGEGLLT